MIKNTLFLLLLLCVFTSGFGQDRKCLSYIDPSTGQEIFTGVSQMPKFPGTDTEMLNYLSEKLGWPENANSSGLIVASYIVNEQGNISNVKLLRKADRNDLNERVINTIQGMPAWVPGKCNGKTVKVEMVIPIRFSLAK